MNKISFTGRLAADSELRYTPAGDAILNFKVASDVGYGDNKKTNWFACTVFGKRGAGLTEYLKKGTQVAIFGSLSLREWERDGHKNLSPDVRVDEVVLMGGKTDSKPRDSQGGSQRPNEDDSSIPF